MAPDMSTANEMAIDDTVDGAPGEDPARRFGDVRFVQNDVLFFVPDLVWIVAAFATLLLPSPNTALLCIAALSLAWTVAVVRRSGGPYLVPSSVMYMASSVFLGFACYYLVVLGSKTEVENLRVTAVILFAATVLMEIVRSVFLMRWRVVWTVPAAAGRRIFEESSPRNYLTKAILLLVLSRAPFLIALNFELANAVGLVGVFMVVLAGVSWRNRIRWGGDLLLVFGSLALPVVWVSIVFQGGGRLTVAGLGIAVAMMWNVVKPSVWFKALILFAVPVFMIGAGINRTKLIEERHGVVEEGSALTSASGLFSVYDPLDRFSTVVLEPDFPGGDGIGPRYGATFVNATLMPVPRSMWEGKPVGFGAEVTALMNPEMVHLGQSFSVLAFGEWYANFGWVGVGLMPVCFGWFIAVLDRRHARLVNLSTTTHEDWWRMVVLGCLVGSLGDLYWGGTFTFFTRGGMSFLVAFAMWRLSRAPAIVSRVPATPFVRGTPTGALEKSQPTP